MSKRIWLDAGHGGTDPGAIGPNGRTEKADNLRLARLLDAAFRRQGCETILTRTADKPLTLEARTKLERDSRCDLAIACHRNAGPESAQGLEIWLHSQAPASYIAWAKEMANCLKALGLPLRNSAIPQRVAPGVFRGYRDSINQNYYANSGTNSPSMLVELGFITNPQDNTLFDEKLEGIAEAMVQASLKFLGVVYRAPVEAPTEPIRPPVDEPTPEPGVDYKARYEGLVKELESVLVKYKT